MTEKDYELITQSIWRSLRAAEWTEKNQVRKQAKLSMARLIANDLMANLAAQHPKFDEAKFLKACGF